MFDFDDLEVTPRMFARLCNSSVAKLARGQVPRGDVERAFSIIHEIRNLSLGEPEKWLTTPYLVDDCDVIPWKVLQHGYSVEEFITNPVKVLNDFSSSWRLLFAKKGVGM